MSENGSTTNDVLAGLLAPLRAEAVRLEAELVAALGRVEEIKQEAGRIRRVLAAAEGPKTKQPKVKSSNAWSVSEDMLVALMDGVRAHAEPVTAATLRSELNLSGTTVRKGLDELRKREQVRIAGKAAAKGRPVLYAPMGEVS